MMNLAIEDSRDDSMSDDSGLMVDEPRRLTQAFGCDVTPSTPLFRKEPGIIGDMTTRLNNKHIEVLMPDEDVMMDNAGGDEQNLSDPARPRMSINSQDPHEMATKTDHGMLKSLKREIPDSEDEDDGNEDGEKIPDLLPSSHKYGNGDASRTETSQSFTIAPIVVQSTPPENVKVTLCSSRNGDAQQKPITRHSTSPMLPKAHDDRAVQWFSSTSLEISASYQDKPPIEPQNIVAEELKAMKIVSPYSPSTAAKCR
jgi:hypothetical protein